ncbi:MAG: 4Fe-4S binding protein [Succinivibrio sp.]|nr:4Fe-4S binding protein [Succinivibrio sp.]
MFFIDQSLCTQCGECSSNCPFESISEHEDGSFVIDAKICTDCGECQLNCPFDAIIEKEENKESA